MVDCVHKTLSNCIFLYVIMCHSFRIKCSGFGNTIRNIVNKTNEEIRSRDTSIGTPDVTIKFMISCRIFQPTLRRINFIWLSAQFRTDHFKIKTEHPSVQSNVRNIICITIFPYNLTIVDIIIIDL